SSASTSILTAEREHFFFMSISHEWQVTFVPSSRSIAWNLCRELPRDMECRKTWEKQTLTSLQDGFEKHPELLENA
ncbi:MAG: hypothetical protein KAT44_00110, partial [Pirellulales bacterium]|nr:hypothetical protein [Pirellulales bacterium]